MDFLDKDTEKLLEDCLAREQDYPTVLKEKFSNLSNAKAEQLRSCIGILVDKGYISKLQWADNLPWTGRIEQKGRNYFREKEVYIRAKLRQDPYFSVLDEESENVLSGLLNSADIFPFITVNAAMGKIYENLEQAGLIKLQQERYAGGGGSFL